ncbi:hypothetical protein BgiMline_036473, partial [Biomphalaria glabrata]
MNWFSCDSEKQNRTKSFLKELLGVVGLDVFIVEIILSDTCDETSETSYSRLDSECERH